MSRVAVVFTGGTIAMQRDPEAGGAVPTLAGAAILERTSGLEAIATVDAVDWGLVPASHLSFAQLLDLAATVRTSLARADVAGAVVVQGTDVIDETAFALDLLVPGSKPIVVTGAMRTSDDDGYDGPTNLRDAVRLGRRPGGPPSGRGGHPRWDGPGRRRCHQGAHERVRRLRVRQRRPAGECRRRS